MAFSNTLEFPLYFMEHYFILSMNPASGVRNILNPLKNIPGFDQSFIDKIKELEADNKQRFPIRLQ